MDWNTVFRAVRVGEVTAVADGRFTQHARFDDAVHRHLHVGRVVQSIEDSEQIHAALGRFFDAFGDDVIRVVGVTECAGSSQEHLRENVGNPGSEVSQPLPRAFFEEPL